MPTWVRASPAVSRGLGINTSVVAAAPGGNGCGLTATGTAWTFRWLTWRRRVSEQALPRNNDSRREAERQLRAHHQVVRSEPVSFAAAHGRIYPKGSPEYDRLLSEARKEQAMGLLRIETRGSFPEQTRTFSARERGHAHAVSEAIEFLSSTVLPEAIERDHRLHDEGSKPAEGFDRGA